MAITRYATASVSTGRAQTSGNTTVDNQELVRAAVSRSGLHGIHAELACDYPIGSGLGGSSAAGVALAGALAVLADRPLAPHALAHLSRDTEVQELGVAGGYQDHFAAAFGGALLLEFSSNVSVTPIVLSDQCRRALPRRGILVYTGESRISAIQITAVRDAYLAGERRVVNALATMKRLAGEMAACLTAGDIDALGNSLNEHWSHQRALHPVHHHAAHRCHRRSVHPFRRHRHEGARRIRWRVCARHCG